MLRLAFAARQLGIASVAAAGAVSLPRPHRHAENRSTVVQSRSQLRHSTSPRRRGGQRHAAVLSAVLFADDAQATDSPARSPTRGLRRARGPHASQLATDAVRVRRTNRRRFGSCGRHAAGRSYDCAARRGTTQRPSTQQCREGRASHRSFHGALCPMLAKDAARLPQRTPG